MGMPLLPYPFYDAVKSHYIYEVNKAVDCLIVYLGMNFEGTGHGSLYFTSLGQVSIYFTDRTGKNQAEVDLLTKIMEKRLVDYIGDFRVKVNIHAEFAEEKPIPYASSQEKGTPTQHYPEHWEFQILLSCP